MCREHHNKLNENRFAPRVVVQAFAAAAGSLAARFTPALAAGAIAGGKPGMKVSWQVTGVRNDAAAVSNPIKVELDKVGSEVGKYINPEAFGQPITKSIDSMAGTKVPAMN